MQTLCISELGSIYEDRSGGNDKAPSEYRGVHCMWSTSNTLTIVCLAGARGNENSVHKPCAIKKHHSASVQQASLTKGLDILPLVPNPHSVYTAGVGG